VRNTPSLCTLPSGRIDRTKDERIINMFMKSTYY
jgi:hypothetical protein